MTEYDLIVIGSGPGGYTTAAAAAAMGRRTMIVERDKLGGTCLNRGCIPTKALCRSAEVAQTVMHASEYGVDVTGVSLDYARAARRKDEVVESLREGVAFMLKDVAVVQGTARFIEPSVIEVEGERYTAPQIIVATGSKAATLPIPGAELAVDSDYMLALQELPASVIIIGGGVIGLEFASILRAFSVEVTVMEYCDEVLPGFDADIAKRVRMALKRRGISVITSAQVTSVAPGYEVEYLCKGKIKKAGAACVMMAVGRKPVIPDGLVELGVELIRGVIKVNDSMETSLPGVYAVGDVNGRCMLAHAATAQGLSVLGVEQNIDVIPSAVFTTPECAMVGLTEQHCRDFDVPYKKGEAIYRSNGKAVAMGEPDGMVKVIIDPATHLILGCHICGAHASDIVQEVAVAMSAGMQAEDIFTAVHSHPTLSELVHNAVSKALM